MRSPASSPNRRLPARPPESPRTPTTPSPTSAASAPTPPCKPPSACWPLSTPCPRSETADPTSHRAITPIPSTDPHAEIRPTPPATPRPSSPANPTRSPVHAASPRPLPRVSGPRPIQPPVPERIIVQVIALAGHAPVGAKPPGGSGGGCRKRVPALGHRTVASAGESGDAHGQSIFGNRCRPSQSLLQGISGTCLITAAILRTAARGDNSHIAHSIHWPPAPIP